MEQIEAGGVVQIKSGGPAMTVVSVEAETVHCLWYGEVNDEVRTANIPVSALVAVMATDEEEEDEHDDEDDEHEHRKHKGKR